MKRWFFLLPLIAMILSACDKELDPENINQTVVFEYEYINHAWVYTHFGWLIDENGDVKGYSRTDVWRAADDDGYITKEDLVNNLSLTDTLYFTVDKDELLNYFDDRFDVLHGQIDTADQRMADAGAGSLYVYVWDVDEEKYKKQLLASRGDLNLTNTKAKVNSIVNWLKEIGDQTDRFFWGF